MAEVENKASKSKAPDGGWGWMVVLGSFIGHFFLVGMARSMGVIYVALLERYEGTAMATALVMSLYNTLRMVLGPLASIAADRFSCRICVCIGSVVASAGFILSAQATKLLHVQMCYGILAGTGASFVFTPMYIIVGHYFDQKKGKAMGISTVGSGLGAVCLSPLLALLLEQYSLFGTFLIMGALILHCILCGILFRPLTMKAQALEKVVTNEKGESSAADTGIELAEAKEGLTDGSAAGGDPGVTNKKTARSRVTCPSFMKAFSVLKNPTFLLYGTNMTAMSFCTQGTLIFLPALGLEKGCTITQASLLLAIAGVSDVVGRFINGVVFDLKPFRHRRRVLHSIVGIASGCTVFMWGVVPSYWSLAAMVVVWGLFEGGFHGQRATIMSEFVSKEELPFAVGMGIFFQGLGNLIAPLTAALIRDTYGVYYLCFYFLGIVITVACSVFLLEYFLKGCYQRRTRESPT